LETVTSAKNACLKAFFSTALLLLVQSGSMAATNTLFNYEFGAAGNTEGWTAAGASLSVSNNLLYGLVSGGDPQILHTGYSFAGSSSTGVLVRMKCSVNGNTDLFWARSGADTYAAGRRVGTSYTGSGTFQTLYFKPDGLAEWDGKYQRHQHP